MEVKKEHLTLMKKIAKFTEDEDWSDDAVINLVTIVSVTSPLDEILKAFESPIDIINLCYLIENHYNLEIVCRKIIEYRK